MTHAQCIKLDMTPPPFMTVLVIDEMVDNYGWPVNIVLKFKSSPLSIHLVMM